MEDRSVARGGKKVSSLRKRNGQKVGSGEGRGMVLAQQKIVITMDECCFLLLSPSVFVSNGNEKREEGISR